MPGEGDIAPCGEGEFAATGNENSGSPEEDDGNSAGECKIPIRDESVTFYLRLPNGDLGVVVSGNRKIDAEAPVVKIFMEGNRDKDGNYYYRADNCGAAVTFSDRTLNKEKCVIRIDGKPYEPGTANCVFNEEENNSESRIMIPAAVIAALPDGTHFLSVEAEDCVGNRAETFIPAGCAAAPNKKDRLRAAFILDKTPPVYTLTIRSEKAANKGILEPGNRFYFNSAYEACVDIREENLDMGRVFVMRGAVTRGAYNAAEEQITQFSKRIRGTVSAEEHTARFEDSVAKDGVYRYEIYGYDKAGNEMIPAASEIKKKTDALEKGSNRSYHIVVDTVPPAGTLSISGDKGEYYSMDSGGAVYRAEPYRRETSADIRCEVDPGTEWTPVRIVCEAEASPQKNSRISSSGEFRYSAALLFRQSGRQQFRVARVIMTDLAGNETVFEAPHTIYLDEDPPETDSLAPAISFASYIASGGQNGGIPLFSGDVPVRVLISDPYDGEGGTGIAAAGYEIYKDGEKVAGGQLPGTNGDDRTDGSRSKRRFSPGDSSLSAEIVIPAGSCESNLVNVLITAWDLAGNRSSGKYTLGIDSTAPEIEVAWKNGTAKNEKYFREARTAAVTVQEKNFDPSAVHISAGNAAEESGWVKAGQDRWSKTLTFSDDGSYILRVSGSDLAGNPAKVMYLGEAAQAFVIDRTPPIVTVSFDNNEAVREKYYRSGRKAHISVSDANFNGDYQIDVRGKGAEILENNNSADLSFSQNGVYSFSGTVTDLAGNVSEPFREPEFIIDTTRPAIEIKGAEDGSANPKPVEIDILASDDFMDPGGLSAELRAVNAGKSITCRSENDRSKDAESGTGTAELRMKAIEEDDWYILTVTARDIAGNESRREISFSENRTGTVFEFEQQDIQGAYINYAVRPSFILHDVDEVTVLAVAVNGREVPYRFENNRLELKNELKEDGKYTISVDTKDKAGNRCSMTPAEFIIDRTPPDIRIEGLSEGQSYFTEAFEIQLRLGEDGDHFRYVKMDGKNIFDPQDVFWSPGKALPGQAFGRKADGSIFLVIGEYGEHTLEAQAEDRAGNVSPVLARRFELRRNFWKRWYSDKMLFVITFMLLGGGAVWGILKYIRFAERKKAKTN